VEGIVLAYFKAQHVLAGTKENHKNPLVSWSSGSDSRSERASHSAVLLSGYLFPDTLYCSTSYEVGTIIVI
jgi:hypothetical protein